MRKHLFPRDDDFAVFEEETLRRNEKAFFKNTTEAVEYLKQLNPAEIYLRDHCKSTEDNQRIWGFQPNQSEDIHSWEMTDNIDAMLHYRYDLHPLNSRSYYLLHYVLSGSPEARVIDNTRTLSPGDCLLIGPQTKHYVHSLNDDTIVIKYYIRKSTFERTFFGWLGENNPLSQFFRDSIYSRESDSFILFRTGRDDNIREIMLSIYVTMINRRQYYNTISEAKLTEFFCCLVRDHIESMIISSTNNIGTNLGRVISYIQSSYKTATLDEAVIISGYSKSYMCRLLRQITGKTFTELLNQTRIDAAAKLLSATELPISDIAEHVGFGTIKHFYRSFRTYKNMTPFDWRKKHQSAQPR